MDKRTNSAVIVLEILCVKLKIQITEKQETEST